MQALARAFVRGADVPETWLGERFDMTWSLQRDGDRWAFLQVPQLLLAGDSVEAA